MGRRGGETNLAAVGPGQLSLVIDDVKFDKYASTLKLHLATTTEVPAWSPRGTATTGRGLMQPMQRCHVK